MKSREALLHPLQISLGPSNKLSYSFAGIPEARWSRCAATSSQKPRFTGTRQCANFRVGDDPT
jgi:hypothetical protein